MPDLPHTVWLDVPRIVAVSRPCCKPATEVSEPMTPTAASTDPTDADDHSLFALVAAYEDALTAGRPLPSAGHLSPELLVRFARSVELLRQLHRVGDAAGR